MERKINIFIYNFTFPKCSGKEAYDRYLDAIQRSKELMQDGKIKLALRVYPLLNLIKTKEDTTEWDQVLIGEYSNI